MILKRKVLWINFIILFGVYALCIFVKHTSPDFFSTMMNGNAEINLQNGRILNWLLYEIFGAMGLHPEKNIVLAQLVLTASAALSSYWVYTAFAHEVEDQSINRVLIQIASLMMFINICFWEGWYAFPETVLFASANLLASYGAFALFAKGVRTNKKRFIVLSHILALVAIYGYQAYVENYIILTAIYLLCNTKCKAEKKGILYTVEVVGISGLISISSIFSMSLFVKLGITKAESRAATFKIKQIFENLKTLWEMQNRIWTNLKGYMPMYIMAILGIVLVIIILAILLKRSIADAVWTIIVLIGCYISIFLPHIVSSYIWAAPRTLIGLFCFCGGVLCLGACVLSKSWIKRLATGIASIFIVVSAVQIQIITVNNIVSTRIDEIQIDEIQRTVDEYEKESGEYVTTFVVGDDTNKIWGNETVNYTIMDTNLRIMSVYYANVTAINYYTGRNYQKKEMTEDEYQRYFDGKSYDYFDLDEQLKFDGDKAYLLIY